MGKQSTVTWNTNKSFFKDLNTVMAKSFWELYVNDLNEYNGDKSMVRTEGLQDRDRNSLLRPFSDLINHYKSKYLENNQARVKEISDAYYDAVVEVIASAEEKFLGIEKLGFSLIKRTYNIDYPPYLMCTVRSKAYVKSYCEYEGNASLIPSEQYSMYQIICNEMDRIKTIHHYAMELLQSIANSYKNLDEVLTIFPELSVVVSPTNKKIGKNLKPRTSFKWDKEPKNPDAVRIFLAELNIVRGE